MTNFTDVTELSGDEVSFEQVERIAHRYIWAEGYCKDKDVAEVACGTGQGLGVLNAISKSFRAGDYSQDILDIAKNHYGDSITLDRFDAQTLPYENSSLDVIILFEAIYYVPVAEKFIKECKRVLRAGGKVLIATANKNLYDFNPSPHSYRYFGVVELNEVFEKIGFSADFYGYYDVGDISLKQKILRPIKKIIVSLGLMPKSMKGKKLLKRFVFGKMVIMPEEITKDMINYQKPISISKNKPDITYKVIYCEATIK